MRGARRLQRALRHTLNAKRVHHCLRRVVPVEKVDRIRDEAKGELFVAAPLERRPLSLLAEDLLLPRAHNLACSNAPHPQVARLLALLQALPGEQERAKRRERYRLDLRPRCAEDLRAVRAPDHAHPCRFDHGQEGAVHCAVLRKRIDRCTSDGGIVGHGRTDEDLLGG